LFVWYFEKEYNKNINFDVKSIFFEKNLKLYIPIRLEKT